MRRLSLALAFLAGAMVMPRLLSAEDILTICDCPPDPCPAGYTEIDEGTLPLAPGCTAGCASGNGPMPWWRRCTRCGDNTCRSGVENGSICGKDCCDSLTPCNTTRVNTTDVYCRKFKRDSGVWTAWQWISATSYNLGWCSDPVNDLCHSHAMCASTESICADVVNTPHWKVLPASCP